MTRGSGGTNQRKPIQKTCYFVVKFSSKTKPKEWNKNKLKTDGQFVTDWPLRLNSNLQKDGAKAEEPLGKASFLVLMSDVATRDSQQGMSSSKRITRRQRKQPERIFPTGRASMRQYVLRISQAHISKWEFYCSYLVPSPIFVHWMYLEEKSSLLKLNLPGHVEPPPEPLKRTGYHTEILDFGLDVGTRVVFLGGKSKCIPHKYKHAKIRICVDVAQPKDWLWWTLWMAYPRAFHKPLSLAFLC